MADRLKTVLLFGAPGAGKGTQGALLGSIPGYFHMSTGDMFRSLDKESELGQIFYEYSSKGELVPDEVTLELWHTYVHAQAILGMYKPYSDLLILDGIPRTVAQTTLMEQYINVLGVVHLSAANPDDMIARLQNRALEQKRVDDAKEDVIRNRLAIYERETRPVLNHYDSSIVHEIDAIGTLGGVLSNILNVVAPIQDTCHAKPAKV
ncbi:MAG: nucleoside monophosphate kinase [Phycisphaerales bacterium]|nr:nucleoside monophosphate kinase [Phycisphaerales bacterium]